MIAYFHTVDNLSLFKLHTSERWLDAFLFSAYLTLSLSVFVTVFLCSYLSKPRKHQSLCSFYLLCEKMGSWKTESSIIWFTLTK